MKKILSLVTGLSVVVCGSAFLAACDDKKEENPPAPPAPEATFTVKTDALTKANDEVKTIFEKVYNKTEKKTQSYDAFKTELKEKSDIDDTDYYVTVGVAANMGDVSSITINNFTYSASDKFLFSVGNNSFIEDEVFDYESGTLRIAAPVVAFELRVSNPTNKIKLNDKEFDFEFDAGTIGSFDWSKVEFGADKKNTAEQVDETNEYNIVVRDSREQLTATPEGELTGGYYLTRSMVNNELKQYSITDNENGFGVIFGWSDDGTVNTKFHGQTIVEDFQHVDEDGAVKSANLTYNLTVVKGDAELNALITEAAAREDKTLVLPCNFELTKQLAQIKTELTIDLNGKTITAKKGEGANDYLFVVGDGGKLTVIGDGTIKSKDQKIFTVWDETANNEALETNLVIEGGTFETGDCEVVYVYNGKAEIKGGSFKSTDTTYNTESKNYTLNCEDTQFTAGKAAIEVTGGEFYKFDPSALNNEPEGTSSYLPETGYQSVEDTTSHEEETWHKVVVKEDAE